MSLLSRVTIRAKLLVLSGVGVVGLAAFAALSWRTIDVIKVGGPHYRAIVQAKDLIADVLPPPAYILESYLNAFQMTAAGSSSELDALIQRGRVLSDDFATRQAFWKSDLTNAGIRASLLEESRQPAERFFAIRDNEFIPALRAGNGDDARDLLQGSMKAAYEEHLVAINKVVEQSTALYSDVEATAASVSRQRIALMLGLGVLAALIVAVLGIAIMRAVMRPLDQAVGALARVAGGDLTTRLDVASQDEVGRMAASLNQAVASMHDTVCAIGANSMTVSASSEELTAVSGQMSANAEETATQANVVSAAAEQVSRNIQTVATGAEELSASIREIAKNTAEGGRVAATAVQVADATNLTVAKLGQSSAEIGSVIKVITSIAEQTNLLALNATIEAARAGEAGKGFAVVANEVKELAKETARATEEIGRRITAIQEDSEGAVGAISEIGAIISQLNDIQSTIASAVEEQSATTAEIGRNVTEAAKGSSEIAQNIAGVAHAAQSTSSGATETQASASELSRMAAELQRLVGHFQVAGTGVSEPARSGNPPTTSRARGNGSVPRATRRRRAASSAPLPETVLVASGPAPGPRR